MDYHGGSLPTYTLSVPIQLLFAMPVDSAHLLPGAHISPPGEDNDSAASCDVEIPAMVLESLRPDSSQSSESTDMELVGEDMRNRSPELTGDLSMDGRVFDVEIIDLTSED